MCAGKKLRSNFTAETIGKRSRAFEQYLSHLCSVAALRGALCVRQFFYLPDLQAGQACIRSVIRRRPALRACEHTMTQQQVQVEGHLHWQPGVVKAGQNGNANEAEAVLVLSSQSVASVTRRRDVLPPQPYRSKLCLHMKRRCERYVRFCPNV